MFSKLIIFVFPSSICQSSLPSLLQRGTALDIKRVVGTNIRAARRTRGLTQFQLAERSGLSADFIGKVERGTTSPSIESLKAIATALNLPLGDFFAGESESGPTQEAILELIGLYQGRDEEEIVLWWGLPS
jgi:transcriptional regulator with XRE-family HTH domain